jgi:hypothetical protein
VEGRISKALLSQDKGGHSLALFPQGFLTCLLNPGPSFIHFSFNKE